MSLFIQKYAPSKDLSLFIKYYYVVKVSGQSENFFFNPPQGTFDLVFFVRNDNIQWLKPHKNKILKSEEIILIGQQESGLNFVLPSSLYCIGVVFYPHALRKLINVPAEEIVDDVIDITELGYKDYTDVFNQLRECDSLNSRINLLNHFFYKKLSAKGNVQDYLDKMLIHFEKNKGATQIKELADLSNMTERTLRRKVKSLLGISPKSFNSILRFNYVTTLLQTHPDLSWQDLTLSGNYYDQNHLIKDFKKYTGDVPSAFNQGNTFQNDWHKNEIINHN